MSIKNLKILQINANKSPTVTESALQFAIENNIHIIAIQEPWLTGGRYLIGDWENTRSINHTSFTQQLPSSSNITHRPRTLFYIARDPNLQASPLTDSSGQADFLGLHVKYFNQDFHLLNLYNEDNQDPSLPDSFTHNLSHRDIYYPTVLLGSPSRRLQRAQPHVGPSIH